MPKHHRKKWSFEDWGRPILKIRDWGRPASRRRFIYFFAHVGLTFSVALLVIALAAGVVLIAIYARGMIENTILNTLVVDLSRINANFGAPAAPSTTPPPAQYVPVWVPAATSATSATPVYPTPASQAPAGSSAPQLPPNLLQSTFYFGFANSPWLDGSVTTMYEDTNESALVFPPNYSWTPVSSGSFTSPGGQAPAGITTKIVQENGAYKVLVFAPDGTPILTATSTPLVSGYPGQVGVGGTTDDFLIVYGGYKGAAARIVRAANGWSVQDVSMYFPYRVMHGGFAPAAVRSGANYYVYSLTPNNPKLVKLFTDASGSIVGAVDLTPLLFPSGVNSAIFSSSLAAKVISTSGTTDYYQFTDNGFKTNGPYIAQSTSLNNYPWSVYGVMLTPDYGSLNGIPVQFYVSNNGTVWQPAAMGEETVFGNETGSKLLWKAVFTPSGNAVSPFLGEVRLDFQVKRPQ
ncbi:hypothetical protein M1432_01895 [Patescibacteria group bacterium]|nr:hypothetical protein [Patescibacteria group bacterium]